MYIHNLAEAGVKFDVCFMLLDTVWVELPFSDVIKKFFIHSRFMSGNDFPGFRHMPKFMINVYNICQTPEICIKSCKCAQTLISEDQYVMKWVEQ